MILSGFRSSDMRKTGMDMIKIKRHRGKTVKCPKYDKKGDEIYLTYCRKCKKCEKGK